MNNYIIEKATRTGTQHEKKGMVNEDRLFVYQNNNCIWMGVFDGVTQGGGGSIAATLACQSMEYVLNEGKPDTITEKGLAIMQRAQEYILNENANHPEYGMLQTTGVIACIETFSNTLTWFSIGDSALLVCPKRKRPEKLTIEDTDIGELISQGKITPKSATQATTGHELNKWLGMNVSPEMIRNHIRTGHKKLIQNESVIICSDGFYTKVPNNIISKLIRKNKEADEFVKTAKLMGSQDDITVILAKPFNKRKHSINGFIIATAILIFGFGFFCGTELTFRLKDNNTILRPIYQETTGTETTDTLKYKSEEYEAF